MYYSCCTFLNNNENDVRNKSLFYIAQHVCMSITIGLPRNCKLFHIWRTAFNKLVKNVNNLWNKLKEDINIADANLEEQSW